MTDNAVAKLAAAYSPEKRDSLQKKGQAFKNGNGESSYPIPDVTHLKAAIRAFGRAKPEDKDRLKRYIIKRAKALGAEDLIPDGWQGGDTSSTSADGEDSALVNLTRVVVPRHTRGVKGRTEDVETYTYERHGKSGIGNSLKGLYHKVVGEGAAGRNAKAAAYGAKLREVDQRERSDLRDPSSLPGWQHHRSGTGSDIWDSSGVDGFVIKPSGSDDVSAYGSSERYHPFARGPRSSGGDDNRGNMRIGEPSGYVSLKEAQQHLANYAKWLRKPMPKHPPTELSAVGQLEQKLELSVDTARVSTVHSPLGKPGGPGLFKTKGLQLPAYIQNIAKALIRDHGFTESHAIATAISRVKVWAAGGGGVSPEVKAAAAKAVAEWEAAKARARATPNKR